MTPFFAIAAAVLAVIAVSMWRRQVAMRREAYIRNFVLPTGLFERLRKTYPHLSLKDCQLVANGLRQFFLAHLKSRREFVSMPSQVADELWHEFILFTKSYDAFCRRAFGKFLHHTPATVLTGTAQSNAGLRRCWWFVCKDDNINPAKPSRLPLLFALDTKLKIPGGFKYAANCGPLRKVAPAGAVIHCGTDFISPSFDGATSGFGDSASSWSSSSSDSGGSSGGGSDGGSGGDSGSSSSGGGGGGDSGGGGASGSSCGGGGCGGGSSSE